MWESFSCGLSPHIPNPEWLPPLLNGFHGSAEMALRFILG